jgi:serine/threonine-protein kinase
MIQCSSCGTVLSENLRSCSNCGVAVIREDETIAIPAAISSRPKSLSTSSRLGVAVALAEEGRFLPGTLVAGRYRVIGLIGRGGMGEVYRATDLTLAQSVALKFLPEDAAANERLLERFHNEVRIARQVSHPNVCRVYDIGEADGLPFISMEYIDGEDLASLLKRIGRLPSDKALEIARKVCAGLAAAHERGVIHRDLKPQNIMLNKRGEVVIMDFGLAAVADALEGVEARNGTPAYMAPEQLRGESVTARSDIYSLGLVIYELFTGKRAFEADTMAELVRMQETSRPAAITSIAAEVDPAVEKVVQRCLHSDPAQRPQTALAVAAALPGGDPLAAALAAGETPSPELVAASGQTEGFALRCAAPCVVLVIIGLIAWPFLSRSVAMLSAMRTPFPPAVLEQKARDMAALFGYSQRPLDWAEWFSRVDGYIPYFDRQPSGPNKWDRILRAESPERFVYRQSPRYLMAPPDGDLGSDRPAMNVPGMASVELDPAGRLRRFAGIAPAQDEPSTPVTTIDPDLLFKQAGLELARFREVTPALAPPLAFDARRAWSGSHPDLPDLSITVEAATYRGALTSFEMRFPWTQARSGLEEPFSWRVFGFRTFTVVLLTAGLFCTIFFARRNLRAGRGDRNGALRLAMFAFVLALIRILATTHWAPRFEMIDFLTENVGVYLLLCGLLWLGYIALEPAVRARWPHSLITWNRLLAGRLGDPRLGSHVLVGVAMGVAMAYLFLWRTYWVVARGASPLRANLNLTLGARALLSESTEVLLQGIVFGTLMFFVLCGLRALLRWDWAAALAGALLLMFNESTVQRWAHASIDLPVYLAVYFTLAWLLIRLGMVAAILTLLSVNLIDRIPAFTDFGAWYNPVAVVAILTIGSIAIYGFWRSQARQALPER